MVPIALGGTVHTARQLTRGPICQLAIWPRASLDRSISDTIPVHSLSWWDSCRMTHSLPLRVCEAFPPRRATDEDNNGALDARSR